MLCLPHRDLSHDGRAQATALSTVSSLATCPDEAGGRRSGGRGLGRKRDPGHGRDLVLGHQAVEHIGRLFCRCVYRLYGTRVRRLCGRHAGREDSGPVKMT